MMSQRRDVTPKMGPGREVTQKMEKERDGNEEAGEGGDIQDGAGKGEQWSEQGRDGTHEPMHQKGTHVWDIE